MTIMSQELEFWDVIVAAVSTVATLVVSYWIFQRGNASQVDRERLETVISPMFDLLEPFLYQRGIDSTMLVTYQMAVDIAKQHSLMAGGKLRSIIRENDTSEITQYEFQRLCQYVDEEYDYLCKSVGIPTRPLSYRIRFRQGRVIRLFLKGAQRILLGCAFALFMYEAILIYFNLIVIVKSYTTDERFFLSMIIGSVSFVISLAGAAWWVRTSHLK